MYKTRVIAPNETYARDAILLRMKKVEIFSCKVIKSYQLSNVYELEFFDKL